MNVEQFKAALACGEGSTIEFKRCGNEVEHDVFESVCAFANRFGGDVYLGVLNDGTVVGVNAANCAAMARNIVNVANDPNLFKPQPFIDVESFDWDGHKVIRIRVPESAEVHSFKGEVYDRQGDSDIRVRATARIAEMFMRKRGVHSERETFPQLTLDDFRLDLLPLVRREAQNHLTDGRRHPWTDMDDMTLFRASGLVGDGPEDGRQGFNLAAVLLLGKDETLARICPQYETDALLRVEDVERYDDRRIVRTNLLESYDDLMEFSRKYLPAPFFLEGDKRINLRDVIVREIVANLLIHREFSSNGKSQFVIERKRLFASNPCQPFRDGPVTPQNVQPRAKNPLIAAFFREIGRADRLGSGVRNLFKYSREYGGADPVFTEGDFFTIAVSLEKLDSIRFPFGKEKVHIEEEGPHIGEKKVHIEGAGPHIGEKKVHIGGADTPVGEEKVHIEPEKVHIGDERPPQMETQETIQQVVEKLDVSRPTQQHVLALWERFGALELFGRREVCAVTGLQDRGASKLLGLLLKARLLDTVTGQGKGRYRFRAFGNGDSENN